MAGFNTTSRDNDPVQTVRTIARVAQMLVELRDEYVQRPRQDTLQQIEQRLDDLTRLRDELRHYLAEQSDDVSL
jgi:Na+/phosphate symporter